MKKVILFALILAVCGVLHNSVLAQERPRYLVTYVRSAAQDSIIRSATVVTVVNQSSFQSCDVRVEWFRAGASAPLCTEMATMQPGAANQFCTRPLGGLITVCSDPCQPQIAGVFQGTAIVSSSDVFECSLIAVDARVYYTTGTGNTDTAVSAISNSKVVFFGEGNLGD